MTSQVDHPVINITGRYTFCIMPAFISVVIGFVEKVDLALSSLGSSHQYAVDQNGFIHASTLVYDGVRDIRRAVLMNKVSRLYLCRKVCKKKYVVKYVKVCRAALSCWCQIN